MDDQAARTKTLAEKSLTPRIARALTAGKQIVIAVSREPSIDQLVAAIGLASLINKQANPPRNPDKSKSPSSPSESVEASSKSAPKPSGSIEAGKPNPQPTRSAIVAFSGQLTPKVSFIKTDDIVSPTIDNYRELIVGIDKNLADKLRYSLDKKMARIHISPFLSNRKGLSAEDLEIGPGAFIIDTLVAVGVNQPAELDPIIGNHLDILKRDRQLITVVAGQPDPSQLFGAAADRKDAAKAGQPPAKKSGQKRTPEPINWCQPKSSCLSEMIFELAKELRVELDTDIATILLTGFISATNRIKLQLAGADQLKIMGQLVNFAGVENKQTVIDYLEDKKFPTAAAKAKASKKLLSVKEQLLTEQEALSRIQVADEAADEARKGLGIRVATQRGPAKAEVTEDEEGSFKELRDVHVTSEGQIVTGPAAAKAAAAQATAETSPAPAGSGSPAPNPVTDVDKLGQAKAAPAAANPKIAPPGDSTSYQPSLIPPAAPASKEPEVASPDLAPSPAAP